MKITKRNGALEPVHFEKVVRRLEALSRDLDNVDPNLIAQRVISGMYDGITTLEVETLTADTTDGLAATHPDYSALAGRVLMHSIHKDTPKSVLAAARQLFNNVNVLGEKMPLIDQSVYDVIRKHHKRLEEVVDYSRDMTYDYFASKTLQQVYLFKNNGKVLERPQHMLIRVAVGLWGDDLDRVIETYELMSTKKYTHASPTLFNAGTMRPQLSSCFTGEMADSVDGIFRCVTQMAKISKYAGGIGVHLHDVRSNGALIRGTNGVSSGLVPILRVLNDTMRLVNQSGRRAGSAAVYLEPSHPDFIEFLNAKRNSGNEDARARDLFYAVWAPDLFFKRVRDNGTWSFFDPDSAPGLADLTGEAYEQAYKEYEQTGRHKRQMPAIRVWEHLLTSIIESGSPYVLCKDACNAKTNQANLGTIKSSNLCAEIVQHSTPDEWSVCNLASLNLQAFVKDQAFDFDDLHRVTRAVVRNINKVIEGGYLPLDEAIRTNRSNRPMGIGIQGLADCFALMKIAFDGEEAALINAQIAATMYHAAVTESVEEAKKFGAYDTFPGSPASQGKLQFDLWGVQPDPRYDWDDLRRQVVTYGLRNSLLIALMPTATTSQLLGNTESFEPFTSLLYLRKTLSGEHVVVCRHLVKELIAAGQWTPAVREAMLASGGSIQEVEGVDSDIKRRYKTIWEIKQRVLVDMAAQRGPYVCQSQSMNLYFRAPNFKTLGSAIMHGWKSGLKTALYYCRATSATRAAPVNTAACISCTA